MINNLKKEIWHKMAHQENLLRTKLMFEIVRN
uniref:Uncharacterized protein n=1 Tax=Rhizophora mucronata TaxID=61149 RepID=A0A2P2NKU3_RHIMU